MKKLATLGVVSLLAISLAACDKADPSAEYQQFKAWSETQAQTQQTALANLQQQYMQLMSKADKTPKEFEELFKTFSEKLTENEKSLADLKVKSAEIKELKEKTQEVLKLSNEVLLDSAKSFENPTEEVKKAILEKNEKLQQQALELQKLQNAVAQKFETKK